VITFTKNFHSPSNFTDELVEPRDQERLRLPEFSQPLVTALQLAILGILESWGVQPKSVVGHSSGEIAAACAAGYLTPEEAIKVAYYRGQAASSFQDESKPAVGMLAVGLGSNQVQEYIQRSNDLIQVGCFNSPNSVTLSGNLVELEKVQSRLHQDGHFAQLLRVNLAYHSNSMNEIGRHYEDLLLQNCQPQWPGKKNVTMFSTVTGRQLNQICDPNYWRMNMISPVRFDEAVRDMVSAPEGADFLIEIGPKGALASPIAQIMKALPGQGSNVQYYAAANRGPDSVKALLDVAGRLFISGGSVNLSEVNKDDQDPNGTTPSVIIDLPNYVWNHSIKYWYESEASKDWRFRKFPHHDLLGAKTLGTSWHAPSWKKVLRVQDVPWLKDHMVSKALAISLLIVSHFDYFEQMGLEIVFPAAGFIAMAVEALYQTSQSIDLTKGNQAGKYRYRLLNVRFSKALVLEENAQCKTMLTLAPCPGLNNPWHEFKISSLTEDVWTEHSRGMIRLEKDVEEGK
jgi:acyl transferase domain-containing protein